MINELMLTHPLWIQLGLVLAHALWQGAAIAIVLAGVLRLLRNASATARYGVCGGALILLVLCPLVTLVYLQPNEPSFLSRLVPAPVDQRVQTAQRADIQTTTSSLATETSAIPGIDFVPPSLPSPPRLSELTPPLENTPTVTAPRWRLSQGLALMALVWAVGVTGLAVRLLFGWLGLFRLRSRSTESVPAAIEPIVTRLRGALGLRRSVMVLASDAVREPVAFGLLRPTVLLPLSILTRCPVELIEAMIAHELAHIRRYDLWVNLFQRVVETLLFYHPAVWWITSRMRLERELCCDDLAVRATGRRAEYAETLVDLARVSFGVGSPALAAGMFTSRVTMLVRVRRVLGLPHTIRDNRFWLTGPLSLLLAGSLILVSRIHAADPDAGGETTAPATAEAPPEEVVATGEAPARIDDGAPELSLATADDLGLGEPPGSDGRPNQMDVGEVLPQTSIIDTRFYEVQSYMRTVDDQSALLAPVVEALETLYAFQDALHRRDFAFLKQRFKPDGMESTNEQIEQLFGDFSALGLETNGLPWVLPGGVNVIGITSDKQDVVLTSRTFSTVYHGTQWGILVIVRMRMAPNGGWQVVHLTVRPGGHIEFKPTRRAADLRIESKALMHLFDEFNAITENASRSSFHAIGLDRLQQPVGFAQFIRNPTVDPDDPPTYKRLKGWTPFVKSIQTHPLVPLPKHVDVRRRESIRVRSFAGGVVTEVSAKSGATVKKGDLLVRLDDEELRLELQVARTRLDSAKKEYDRANQLLISRSLSPLEVAKSESAYRLARLEVQRWELKLDRANIRSPVDGIVRSVSASLGKKIEAGELVVWVEPREKSNKLQPASR